MAVVLIAALACGWVARRLGQARVIGETVGGILVGRSIIGRLAPHISASLFPPSSLASFEILSTIVQSAQAYSILAGSDIDGDGFPFNDRVGYIGRNTYQGAPYYDPDLRLERLFSLSERYSLVAVVKRKRLLRLVTAG